MASLRRLPNSPFWIACFSLPDGKRTQRSTKTTDRREAQRIANKFEDAANDARRGRLTEQQARRVIADIYAIGNQDSLPNSTTKEFFNSWLSCKELEAGEKTHVRYQVIIQQFLDYLGPKAGRDISHLTSKEINGFKAELAKRSSTGTINVNLKVLRAALNHARRAGLVDQNEAEKVELIRKQGKSTRRPFTIDELKKILSAANQEWRGMILFGLYTGLRLGDIAQLTWNNIDLLKAPPELNVQTQKTGRHQNLPLATPLTRYLDELPTSDNPGAPLFPKAFACYEQNYFNGSLSKQFYSILVSAGLAQRRINRETGKGHKVRHKQNELSFHCLRHTATSLLKNAGVSDAIARDIIGHESPAVSAQYTHIDMEAKRQAINKLPDILS